MKKFANGSTALLIFGCVLFVSGTLDWMIDFIKHGPADFPIHLGFSSIALTGLVATIAAAQLKKLEARLDEMERARAPS